MGRIIIIFKGRKDNGLVGNEVNLYGFDERLPDQVIDEKNHLLCNSFVSV